MLEIGPGPDLGTGAVLLADGASSYHAVDMFALADRDLTSFYAALERRIGPIDPSRLSYTIGTFPDLPEISGDFDVVVSHATLEHVDSIQGVFHRLHQLVPAGVMCHYVDAMTHTGQIRNRDPLNILRFGTNTYRLMSFRGIPNRLRAADYADAAAAAGFGNIRIVPEAMATEKYLERARPKLAARFAERDDVDLLTFNILTGVSP